MNKRCLLKYYLVCLIPSYTAFYILIHQIIGIETFWSYIISSFIGGTTNLFLYKRAKVF